MPVDNTDPHTAKNTKEFGDIVSKVTLFPELVEALEAVIMQLPNGGRNHPFARFTKRQRAQAILTKAKELI